jgi:hypothetical protein
LKTILEEANELTSGARQDVYGHPLENYRALAAVWTAILQQSKIIDDGRQLTPELCQVMLMGMKVVRLGKEPEHRDSIIDVAGYARTLEMTIERQIELFEEG